MQRTSEQGAELSVAIALELEDKVSRQITDAGLPLSYEEDKIQYVWPERSSTYTPDFKLPKQGGFFTLRRRADGLSNRHRHLLIKQQRPNSTSAWFSIIKTPSSTRVVRLPTHSGVKSMASDMDTKPYPKNG